jgi:hypothetical protein
MSIHFTAGLDCKTSVEISPELRQVRIASFLG